MVLFFERLGGRGAYYNRKLLFLMGLTILATVFGYNSCSEVWAGGQMFGEEEQQVRLEIVSEYLPGAAGGQFGLAVVFHVDPEWYIYANPKGGAFGMDTVLMPEDVEGVTFGEVVYPKGKFYDIPELDDFNYIYKDGTVCFIPVTVDEGYEGTVAINITVEGQMCSDDGQCIPWDDTVSAELPLVLDSSLAQVNKPELFAEFSLLTGQVGEVVGEVGEAVTEVVPERVEQTEPTEPPLGTEAAEGGDKGGFAADAWLIPILAAVLAGIVMNAMPCVLPIIPIVIMTLMKQCAAEEGSEPDRGKSIKVGLAFAAGIMIVFGGLAIIMTSFNMLWGQHFQSNGFRFVLLMIVFVLGLSMFGLFEIVLPARLSNMSVNRQGYAGALGMGMLATVLATPCGAPLLGPVLAWSVVKPPVVTFVMFLIIGMGMAFPYVALTAFPRLMSRIPQAGNWMIRLKQAIGFAMLGFSVWIIFLFPVAWYKPLVYFCLVLGFCIWLGLSLGNPTVPVVKRYLARGIALVLVVASSVAFAMAPKVDKATSAEPWHVQLARLQEQNQTVVVKFTANWCKNCAVLDKSIYKTDTFKNKLAETNTAFIVADWSYEDPSIKQVLVELGGPGQSLPFTAIYPGGDPEPPITLEAMYSMEDILGALDEAAKRGDGK
ncbi:MAG: hypothetical protein GY869_08775 [Planctomycetes bacterium]|nr:hypothetical protein [Planctomycetota bacterium]